MANINLHQTYEEKEEKRSFLDTSIFVSLAILVVVLLAYGALVLYNSSLQSSIADANAQTDVTTASIDAAKLNRVHDFNLRLELLQEMMKGEATNMTDLQNIESSMISGVWLANLEYNEEENTYLATGVADTTEAASKQVFQFKSNDYFSNVSVDGLSIEEGGKISFQMMLTPRR